MTPLILSTARAGELAVRSVSRSNLFAFSKELQTDYSVFVPVKKADQRPVYRQFVSLIPSGETDASEEAGTCVECGACNAIYPTCHCFLLYDQRSAESMARLRLWDCCMVKDFARVAGGAH